MSVETLTTAPAWTDGSESSTDGTHFCNTIPRHFSGFTDCYETEKRYVPAVTRRREKKAKKLEGIQVRANDLRLGSDDKTRQWASGSKDDLHHSGGERKGTVWTSASGCRHAARP